MPNHSLETRIERLEAQTNDAERLALDLWNLVAQMLGADAPPPDAQQRAAIIESRSRLLEVIHSGKPYAPYSNLFLEFAALVLGETAASGNGNMTQAETE